MDEKEIKNSLLRNFFNIFRGCSGIYTEILELMKLELQLAKLSILFLLIVSLAIFVLLGIFWFFLMALLTVFFYSISGNWFLALTIILLLNLVLIVALIIIAIKLVGNLKFSATRRQLLSHKKV